VKQYIPHKIIVPRFSEAEGFYTTKTRSKNMSKIRGKNTKPELKLRKVLWSLGYRYRKNVKTLPGTPDLVYMKQKLTVFVDGEFWHGFNWAENKTRIKTNPRFWIPKIERNMQRDWETNKALVEMGYTVMRFWQQEIEKDFISCLRQVIDFLEERK
jgi:DNA mismatch endonuclease (patch repair protein)